ncbi:MAG: sigma-70 family RNA polymerase sigma factor [Solibacillus sp.]|uniref:sigma-70 family RNA polymerase sigma factor n=1 Tax=unclassified Solibacillus TaxID=2637870 RepID=UPI0031010D85
MDEKIISLIKSKQEKGIKLLLEQYGGLMKAIALKYLAGRPQELEETMADMTIAIWYHIDDFDPDKNTFKNWVAAIAKFKAIDALRKIERAVPTAELQDSIPQQERDEIDWQTALANLPFEERQLFESYYFKGQSTNEIATQLHVKPSWVHNKLSRTRKKLKDQLLKGGYKDEHL